MTPKRNINKKVVFILSSPRSGSHWLSYVLGSHRNSVHLGAYYRWFQNLKGVICNLCLAKGRTQCEFLHGIEKITKKNAHNFAFERFQKPILIDCSKELDWLKTFIGSKSYQIKVVHLLRDPRAWFASMKRRNKKVKVKVEMNRWVSTNVEIIKTIQRLSLPSVTVFYDELCIRPDHHFKRVCAFIGMPFEKSALKYWEKEHHGIGNGGASFNHLKNYRQPRLITDDDEFYADHAEKIFYDSRWTKELSRSERIEIENSEQVEKYLSFHSLDLSYFDALRANAKK